MMTMEEASSTECLDTDFLFLLFICFNFVLDLSLVIFEFEEFLCDNFQIILME